MTFSKPDNRDILTVSVGCASEFLIVNLADGRVVSAPLSWYPRLVHATQAERDNWQLEGGGSSIHWPDLDEDIGVDGLLAGRPSGEGKWSFARWLKAKQEGRGLTIPELDAYDEAQRQHLAQVD